MTHPIRQALEALEPFVKHNASTKLISIVVLTEDVARARAAIAALRSHLESEEAKAQKDFAGYAIDLLVATGHVSREKANEAYRIACDTLNRAALSNTQVEGGSV